MVFDLSNGVPLLTGRKMKGIWEQAVAEMIAFINGARTIDEIAAYGTKFWDSYRGKGVDIGLGPNDMGPGSYGPTFHDYETPDGGTLNQFELLLEQIALDPSIRTLKITSWKPYYTARGENRKVIVAPCHGDLQFRIIDDALHMEMHQRSADFAIGVPNNSIQYAALLCMICQVTGYRPGTFIHSFADAHIYENQISKMLEFVDRPPRKLPRLWLDPSIMNLFDFRIEHFSIDEYNPYPGMKIPYSP
jgi:thymidylate synthase